MPCPDTPRGGAPRQTRPAAGRSRSRVLGSALSRALCAALIFCAGCSPGRQRQKPQFRLAKVDRGNVLSTVSATGTLNAVTTVQVGSQVSGNIYKLYADFNSKVKKGQLVAEIDPSTFQATVDQATANVAAAAAGVQQAQADVRTAEVAVETAKADLATSQASLRKAQAVLVNNDLTLKRTQELARKKFVAQQDLDTALANRNTAAADVDTATAGIASSRARIMSAEAGVGRAISALASSQAQHNQTRATLKLAQVNLDRCKITSPIDGVVVNRTVDVGQTVAASLSAPQLFQIANDLSRMQIDANVDEADIGRVKNNQVVEFTVDAYPDDRFKGTVIQMRLQPIVSQNVVTYDTVVKVVNEQLLLRPGMTANIYIQVAQAKNVIRIPNAALSYKPSARPGAPPPPPPTPKKGVRTVYHPSERGWPRPIEIKIGISDGTYTEVLPGSLEEGDQVILGTEGEEGQDQQSGPTNPFAPRRR
jgi:HlyD family secretion protein